VSILNGLDHRLFVDFVGASLNHDDPFAGTHHHQAKIAIPHVRIGRIDYELAIDTAHANRTDGALKRNLGQS